MPLGKIVALLLLFVVCSACTTPSTLPTAVDVDRKQNLLVPQGLSDTVSRVSNRTMHTVYQIQGLVDNPSVSHQDQRAQHLLDRLVAHVDAISPDASKWSWEIHVIDRGVVNAYAMGAGKIMVYRGLIEHLAFSEDELAFVIAHEMAHNLRLHARENLSNVLPFYAAGIGLSQALSPWGSAMIMDYGVEKNMSRSMEIEADRIGLELMARAGFQPTAAAQSFVKFHQHEMMARDAMAYVKVIPRSSYLRTHPLSEEREIDMQQQSSNIENLYASSEKFVPADQALSAKTSVNLDYIDDYEKLYLIGRIAPQTVVARLLHLPEDISLGTDLGYGWMFKRTPQGGLNGHVGLTLFQGDPQITGWLGGGYAEIGWVFNPHWQVYGRAMAAQDLYDAQRTKQKIAAGLRWGNFTDGFLYLETSQGKATFHHPQTSKSKNLVEFGYAVNFGLF